MRIIVGLALLAMQSTMSECECPVCDPQIHDPIPASTPDLNSAQPLCKAAIPLRGDVLTTQMDPNPAVPLCFNFDKMNNKDLEQAGFDLASTVSYCKWSVVGGFLQPTDFVPTKNVTCGMTTPKITIDKAKYRFAALSIMQQSSIWNADPGTIFLLYLNNGTTPIDLGPKQNTMPTTTGQSIQSTFIFDTKKLPVGNDLFQFYFELKAKDPVGNPSWNIESLAILGIP